MQKSSYLLFPYYLYYLRYSFISVYNLSIRKYFFIAALLQPFIYYFANLVRTPKFFSYSRSSSHLALSIPVFSLLITFYIGALSLIRPNIANL